MTKSREIRQKILKIMDLALKISPPDVEKVQGTPDVFVRYYPHCCVLEVEIYKHGWICDPSERCYFSTNRGNANKGLDKLIEYLRNLREDTENEQN